MLLTADYVWVDGEARAGIGVRVDGDGRVAAVGPLAQLGVPDLTLARRLVVPGCVNAHSHAFQRALRGRTQRASTTDDNFWSWREAMYAVAGQLDPDSIRTIARQAFLELLLAGVTTVGEFHYVHHRADGSAYEVPQALAVAVLEAARDVGLRVALLRSVYLTGDFEVPPTARQRRFCDGSLDEAIERAQATREAISALRDPTVTFGLAPHSVRAVPITAMAELKERFRDVPFHVHASEQPREVERCIDRHGMGPVALLDEHGILDERTVLVHATHLREGEADLVGVSRAGVCFCPTTEADLGDGMGPAAELMQRGVPLSLGTDGQTSSSLWAEAARLEQHERLRWQKRNVLAAGPGASTGAFLLDCATRQGARALGVATGELVAGAWADLVALDLDDSHLAGLGADALADGVVFSGDTRMVTDVMVGGRWRVRHREHAASRAVSSAYRAWAARVA